MPVIDRPSEVVSLIFPGKKEGKGTETVVQSLPCVVFFSHEVELEETAQYFGTKETPVRDHT
jgi:hypothetical protein